MDLFKRPLDQFDASNWAKRDCAINMGQSIQEWTKSNLWKTAFRKFEGVWSVSTNFTWSILDLVFQS